VRGGPAMGVLVKICGLTRGEEVDWAVEAGADAVGFVFHPLSRRRLDPEQARVLAARVPGGVTKVGVVDSPDLDGLLGLVDAVPLDAVQWHGRYRGDVMAALRRLRPDVKLILAVGMGRTEAVRSIQQALRLANLAEYFLLDTAAGAGGGTGLTWEWASGQSIVWPRPVIVAGGLTPENVGRALDHLLPAGVDVSSGVERDGVKDRHKVFGFVRAVRSWERTRGGSAVDE